MKLSTREDIEAPVDYVFACVSDFETFERRAMREGAAVLRQDAGPVAVGSAWDITVPLRGRDRRFASVLTAMATPDGYLVTTLSDGLMLTTQVGLVALSRDRTRVTVAIDITARTLTARLLVQSLKLGKSRLSEGLKARIHSFGQGIEAAYPKGS